jgi:hypothetical protein
VRGRGEAIAGTTREKLMNGEKAIVYALQVVKTATDLPAGMESLFA